MLQKEQSCSKRNGFPLEELLNGGDQVEIQLASMAGVIRIECKQTLCSALKSEILEKQYIKEMFFVFCFVVLEFEFRVYTLNHSTSPCL
jgi:hypothetical protein